MRNCRQKIPPAALLKALPDKDPRLTTVQAMLDMLSQFSHTLTEMCQGPNVENQRRCMDSQIAEESPSLLWFLTRRQQWLHQSTGTGLSEERKRVRQKRLNSFCTSEGSIICLLLSMVEGGARDVISKFVDVLKKTHSRDIGPRESRYTIPICARHTRLLSGAK